MDTQREELARAAVKVTREFEKTLPPNDSGLMARMNAVPGTRQYETTKALIAAALEPLLKKEVSWMPEPPPGTVLVCTADRNSHNYGIGKPFMALAGQAAAHGGLRVSGQRGNYWPSKAASSCRPDDLRLATDEEIRAFFFDLHADVLHLACDTLGLKVAPPANKRNLGAVGPEGEGKWEAVFETKAGMRMFRYGPVENTVDYWRTNMQRICRDNVGGRAGIYAAFLTGLIEEDSKGVPPKERPRKNMVGVGPKDKTQYDLCFYTDGDVRWMRYGCHVGTLKDWLENMGSICRRRRYSSGDGHVYAEWLSAKIEEHGETV